MDSVAAAATPFGDLITYKYNLKMNLFFNGPKTDSQFLKPTLFVGVSPRKNVLKTILKHLST